MANWRPGAGLNSALGHARGWWALLSAALLALACATVPLGVLRAAEILPAEDRKAPLEWNAQGGLSCTPSHCVARKFVASQGGLHIRADEAEGVGLNVQNSHWTLIGNLEITLPQGQLHADRCDVRFDERRIRSAHCTGMPAVFDEPGQPGHNPARGHALDIDYDVERNEVELTGDAWLTDGCNEINTEHMTYNLTTQGIQATSPQGGDQRVRGTVRCRAGSAPGAAPDNTGAKP
jgi:lipopolysaccharide transport protein LptA